MAKGKSKKIKSPAHRRVLNDNEIVSPTVEQLERARFELEDIIDRQGGGSPIRIGKAYRKVPMIDTLLRQEVISHAEHKALKHYRHHADLIDCSPLKDSIRKLLRVAGGRPADPSARFIAAGDIVRGCEAAAGSLADILRAIVVDDVSLSQWAMSRYGAREKCRQRAGERVCRMEPSEAAVALARLEFRMAAKRVHAELEA